MKQEPKLNDLAMGLLEEQLAAEARELEGDVSKDGPAHDEELALSGFRSTLEQQAKPAQPKSPALKLRRLIYPLIAAAAALVIWIQNPGPTNTIVELPIDQTLGADDTLHCLAPLGTVDSLGTFTWSLPVEPMASTMFVVQIFSDDQALVFETKIFNQTEWTPSPLQLAELPASFTWSVTASDMGGNELGTGSGQVNLQ